MRRDLSQELFERVERVLRHSIEFAFANPLLSREYVKQHAQELEDEVIEKHISLFVNDYSLNLGKEGLLAIEQLTGLSEV